MNTHIRIFTKNFLIFLVAVFILTAPFFSNSAQASFWDIIRAWVTINPLEVSVSVPAEVEIDKIFKVEAVAANKGGERIENVKEEIFLPPELVLIQKDSIKKIGVIPGKRERTVFWSVKGEAVGNYIISILVSGELGGQVISAEDTTNLVEIKESVKKTGPQDWLQNISDLFQRLF